jgi:MFS family permease
MSETTPQTQPTGYLALIRANHNFRNLWLGQIISLLGDWFNLIASAALVSQLSGSSGAIGVLFVIRMLAPFLISPLAGVWADRYDRRKILILTDLLRAITLFGFLLVREPEHIWLLYVLTAFQLGVSGVFYPTRTAILPDIVDKSELGAANALSSATWSVMLALGAALGGLSAGIWGIYPSFIIDSFTFFLSAYFIIRIRYHHKAPASSAETSISASLRQYLNGLRYLKNNIDILVITTLKASRGLIVSGPFQVIQVVIAEQIFAIGEGGGISLGLMYASVGLGTGIGPILARRFTGDRPRPLRNAIVLSFLISSIGLALIAMLQNFGLVLIGTLLRGVGVGINWVFSNQLLLHLLPDRVRGRVFSTEFAFLTLMNATGSAIGGWVVDMPAFSVAGIMWWLAGLTLIPGLLWGLWVKFGSQTE